MTTTESNTHPTHRTGHRVETVTLRRGDEFAPCETLDLPMPPGVIVNVEGRRDRVDLDVLVRITDANIRRRFHLSTRDEGIILVDEGHTLLFHGAIEFDDEWIGKQVLFVFEERDQLGEAYGSGV